MIPYQARATTPHSCLRRQAPHLHASIAGHRVRHHRRTSSASIFGPRAPPSPAPVRLRRRPPRGPVAGLRVAPSPPPLASAAGPREALSPPPNPRPPPSAGEPRFIPSTTGSHLRLQHRPRPPSCRRYSSSRRSLASNRGCFPPPATPTPTVRSQSAAKYYMRNIISSFFEALMLHSASGNTDASGSRSQVSTLAYTVRGRKPQSPAAKLSHQVEHAAAPSSPGRTCSRQVPCSVEAVQVDLCPQSKLKCDHHIFQALHPLSSHTVRRPPHFALNILS